MNQQQQDEYDERKDRMKSIFRHAFEVCLMVHGMRLDTEVLMTEEQTTVVLTYAFPDEIEQERIYKAFTDAMNEYGDSVPDEYKIPRDDDL